MILGFFRLEVESFLFATRFEVGYALFFRGGFRLRFFLFKSCCGIDVLVALCERRRFLVERYRLVIEARELLDAHEYEQKSDAGIAQRFAADEQPGHRVLRAGCRHSVGIVGSGNDHVEHARSYTRHTSHYRAVYRHAETVGTRLVHSFLMVERVGEQCERKIHRRRRAERFNNERRNDEIEVGRVDKAYRAAYRRKYSACEYRFALAYLIGERPGYDHAERGGYSADYGQRALEHAAVGGRVNEFARLGICDGEQRRAEVKLRNVFQHAAELIQEEEQYHQPPELVFKADARLLAHGYGFLLSHQRGVGEGFFGDALAREVVLHYRADSGNDDKRDDEYLPVVERSLRVDDSDAVGVGKDVARRVFPVDEQHAEEERQYHRAQTDGGERRCVGYGRKQRAVLAVARRKVDERGVGRIIERICDGKPQVIAYRDKYERGHLRALCARRL